MLVQRSPLLFYCVLTGEGPPMPEQSGYPLSNRQTFFGHAALTEAGRTAGFCQIGCSTHGLNVGRFLLNRVIQPDIRPVCTRLKDEFRAEVYSAFMLSFFVSPSPPHKHFQYIPYFTPVMSLLDLWASLCNDGRSWLVGAVSQVLYIAS